MRHRIFAQPDSTINETWASLAEIEFGTYPPHKDPMITGDHHDDQGFESYGFYQKVALDIVTETVFDYPYPRLSEKTIKPLAWKRMFIIIGAQGSLQHLRDLGFSTFAPFINEHYDTIADPASRMQAVMSEVVRFCSMDLDQVRQQMLQYKDRLDHNKKLYDHYQQEQTIREQIRQQLCLDSKP